MKQTKWILGLFPVKAYDYNWNYTLAQIHLMLCDRTLVLYKKKNGKNGSTPSRSETEKLYDEWLEKKNEQKSKGIKMNLNDWMNG